MQDAMGIVVWGERAAHEVAPAKAQKKPSFLAEARKPSVLSGPVHPFGSLAALSVPLGRLRAHGFASPPHDGFAISRITDRPRSKADSAASIEL
jgi:hypothetical protein